MIYEFAHVAVYVRDVDRSVEFYTRCLGAQIVREAFIPATQTKCLYLQISAGVLELLCRERTAAHERIGFDHVAFMVTHLDATYQDFLNAGLKFTVAPKVAGSGNGRVAFLVDPGGTRVELIERKDNFRIPRIEEGMVKAFAHVSITVRDLVRAEEFYVKYMGLEIARRVTVGSRKVVYLAKGVDTLQLANETTSERTTDGIDHIAFSVADVDRAVSILRTRGVACGAESRREPDGTRACVVRDPDGTRIALVSH